MLLDFWYQITADYTTEYLGLTYDFRYKTARVNFKTRGCLIEFVVSTPYVDFKTIDNSIQLDNATIIQVNITNVLCETSYKGSTSNWC